MITSKDVTSCLVTRGDQPDMIRRIRDTLIFDNVVVWDNSQRTDWKTAGRYMAAEHAPTDIVYFQDDDVIVPPETQHALLAEYEPGWMVANWAHGDNPDGYEDIPLVGAGAIVDRDLPREAMWRYLEHHPLDDEFLYDADYAVGTLYQNFRHVYLPFHIELPVAQHPSRLCNQPWQRDLKRKVTDQARRVRDLERAAA